MLSRIGRWIDVVQKHHKLSESRFAEYLKTRFGGPTLDQTIISRWKTGIQRVPRFRMRQMRKLLDEVICHNLGSGPNGPDYVCNISKRYSPDRAADAHRMLRSLLRQVLIPPLGSSYILIFPVPLAETVFAQCFRNNARLADSTGFIVFVPIEKHQRGWYRRGGSIPALSAAQRRAAVAEIQAHFLDNEDDNGAFKLRNESRIV